MAREGGLLSVVRRVALDQQVVLVQTHLVHLLAHFLLLRFGGSGAAARQVQEVLDHRIVRKLNISFRRNFHVIISLKVCCKLFSWELLRGLTRVLHLDFEGLALAVNLSAIARCGNLNFESVVGTIRVFLKRV